MFSFHNEACRGYKKPNAFAERYVDHVEPCEQDQPSDSKDFTFGDGGRHIYLFTEDDDDIDEGWTTIETSHEVPEQEDHETSYNVSNTVSRLGGRLKAQGVQRAFEAAGVAGTYAKVGTSYIAEGFGFFSNCDTMNEVVKQVLTKYPTLQDLRTAYGKGRDAARKARRGSKVDGIANKHADKMREHVTVHHSGSSDAEQPTSTKPRSKTEMDYGELEEVPIVDDVDGQDWEQFEYV